MTDGTEVDRVELLEFVDGTVGQNFTGAQITLAAEIEVLQFVLDPLDRGDRLENFQAFGRYLGPRTVSADNGNLQSARRVQVPIPYQARPKKLLKTRNFNSPPRCPQAAHGAHKPRCQSSSLCICVRYVFSLRLSGRSVARSYLGRGKPSGGPCLRFSKKCSSRSTHKWLGDCLGTNSRSSWRLVRATKSLSQDRAITG